MRYRLMWVLMLGCMSCAQPTEVASRQASEATSRQVAEAASRPTTEPSGDVRSRDLPHTTTVFQPTRFASLDEWTQRRQWLREQVRFAAGLIPAWERTGLNAKVFGRLDRGDYTIEKVYFESLPGLFVTGNLYRPVNAKGRVPAVACPHGHWSKGRLAHEELGSVPARCITLARLGAVVFSYDMIGYNDSARQIDHCDKLLNSPASELWCLSSLGMQTWTSVRVLDFLQSLPEVDPERIGVTGASGGGTQTFILCAVDDRPKVAAPVNMISSIMQGGCICENAALLRIDANNMEIGALFAPQPLLMVSATGDWTKNTPQVEYPMIRGVYELYGAADKVANVHIDAPHNYNLQSREAVYRFFGKHLLGRKDADAITEGNIQVEKPEDLLVFNDNNLPANMLKPEQLVEQLKRAARQEIELLQPTQKAKLGALSEAVRLGLRYAIGSAFPGCKEAVAPRRLEYHGSPASGKTITNQRGKLRYERNGRGVEAIEVGLLGMSSQHGPGGVAICVHPDGMAAADQLDKMIDDWLAATMQRMPGFNRFILIEPFGTGGNKPPADLAKPRGSTQYFTTFNRTDAAETVFDILTVLGAVLRDSAVKNAHLIGFGETGPLCLVARAMVPDELARTKRLRTVIDMNGFDTESDQVYVEHLFLPGIRRIGGLPAISAVAANGPLFLHNPGPRFDAVWARSAAKLNGVEVRIQSGPADADMIAKWLLEP